MHQKKMLSYCSFHISFDATCQIQLLIVASQECLQPCTSHEVEESIFNLTQFNWEAKRKEECQMNIFLNEDCLALLYLLL